MFDLLKLKVIDLSYNNLESIPPEVSLFTELTELYLNNNPIQNVPIEFALCTKLKVLELSSTFIKWLPRDMANLKSIYLIGLNNCPLAGNLAEIYTQGINSMMRYFQRKYDRSKYRVK